MEMIRVTVIDKEYERALGSYPWLLWARQLIGHCFMFMHGSLIVRQIRRRVGPPLINPCACYKKLFFSELNEKKYFLFLSKAVE